MIISVEGEEATTKTTFAYTAPLKIVGFQPDMGVERAIYGAKFEDYFKDLRIKVVPYTEEPLTKQWGDQDITVYELPPPIQLGAIRTQGYRELWQNFIRTVGEAYKDPEVKSVVFDTMTLIRRIRISMHLQHLQDDAFLPNGEPRRDSKGQSVQMRRQLQQIEYGVPNDDIRLFYTNATRINLIAVHHLTDEYKEVVQGDGRITTATTGNRILEGLGNTYRFVDVAIRMLKGPQHKIECVYKKVGYNLTLEGMRLENPTWDLVATAIEGSLGGRVHLDKRAEVSA